MSEIIIVEQTDDANIINRGTGAGGARTNHNGLFYESITDLKPLFSSFISNKKNNYNRVQFVGYEQEFINVNQSALHRYMNNKNEKNKNIQPAAGCKKPDEAYINETTKQIFIIEKKFQQGSGSVDEKIQTGPFKKRHYKKLFQNYNVHYIYCLSDWFKRDEYKSVLEYLEESEIPVFWGNDADYKNKIVDFICLQN